MAEIITMYERLYFTASKLKLHLETSLLKERESFLSQKEKGGNTQDRLRVLASYLLYAIQSLGLTNGQTSYIDIGSLIEISHAYRNRNKSRWLKENVVTIDYRFNDVICNLFEWMCAINLIEPMFIDKESIFNRLFDDAKTVRRLSYYTAPFYKERLGHLHDLEKQGMCYRTLQEYAECHLHIIKYLNLSSLPDIRPYTINELVFAARQYSQLQNGVLITSRYRRFRAISISWFGFMGLLKTEKNEYAESEIVDNYCEWLVNAKGLAVGTIEFTRMELKRFFGYIHNQNLMLHSLSVSCMDSYLANYQKEGYTRKTIAGRVSCIKMFLKHAFNQKFIAKDLSLNLNSPKIYKDENLPVSPKKEDVYRMVDFYDETSVTGIRNKTIILLLVEYGMRNSEVANLKLEDIDWEKETISIKRVKGFKSQIFKLKPNVGNMLLKYLTESRRNDMNRHHLFLGLKAPYKPVTCKIIYHLVSHAFRTLDIQLEHIGPHALRKAYATILVNSGHSLKDVSNLLGHKLLDTTRIYAKVDFANLRQVADINWEGLL
jgi:site-specific recombinase XerD